MSYRNQNQSGGGGGDDSAGEEEEEQDIPQELADLAGASVPNSLRSIRACKRCGILKTVEQFVNEGCENCPFLDMADNTERCIMCTTPFYEGHAAIMDPRESWAAKWIRTDNYLPGIYAIAVTGEFDREIEEDLEQRGIRWRCRPFPTGAGGAGGIGGGGGAAISGSG